MSRFSGELLIATRSLFDSCVWSVCGVLLPSCLWVLSRYSILLPPPALNWSLWISRRCERECECWSVHHAPWRSPVDSRDPGDEWMKLILIDCNLLRCTCVSEGVTGPVFSHTTTRGQLTRCCGGGLSCSSIHLFMYLRRFSVILGVFCGKHGACLDDVGHFGL